jgi:hypothetical protein
MNDAYHKAQIEQLEMICARLETDVDNLRIEIERLKAGVHLQRVADAKAAREAAVKVAVDFVGDFVGESWQAEDVEP